MITVESTLGRGTTVFIHLPVSEKKVQQELKPAGEAVYGNETILLVDDEEMIIEVGQAMLAKLGYKVIIAKNGEDAVGSISKLGDRIDLVILDMIMPGLNGNKTFDRMRAIKPDLRVMLSSGYSVDGQAREILDKGCCNFIQKPFNLLELSQKVREAIDL
jgi:DNA-binding NtrC family response regulator